VPEFQLYQVFEDELKKILEEMNEMLAA